MSTRRVPIDPRELCSPREAEVLAAVGERLSNAQIAARLFISVRTVESHVSSLMAKLGAADRHGLARLAPPRPGTGWSMPAVARTAFVGRRDEFDRLRKAVGRALRGGGAVVLIGGPPGIGKTRLAEEAAAHAVAAGMTVHAGHSYEAAGAPAAPQTVFGAFVEILESALAAAPDPASFAGDCLGDGAPEIARLIPALRRALPDLPPPLDLPAAQERPYLFRCLAEAFARLAARAPLLLLLDDFQWADSSTLDFVEYLAPRLPSLPVLLVATYRDADVRGPLAATLGELHRRRLTERIRVGPLEFAEVAELVAAISGLTPSAELVSDLVALTDGNPFFTEEVVRDLVETGALEADAVDLRAVAVPDGVHLVIGRRLDRLTPLTRDVLVAAAVAGRVFSLPLLALLADLNSDRVLDVVDEAIGAALIAPAGGEEFLFTHELVRQALRDRLSEPRRRRAHARAADALTRVHAEALDEHAAVIAEQLARAGAEAAPRALFEFTVRAGRRAIAVSAFDEAVAALRTACGAGAGVGTDELAALQADLGRAYGGAGRLDQAVAAWRESVRLLEILGDTAAAGTAAVALSWTLVHSGRIADSLVAMRHALDLIGAEPTVQRAEILAMLAIISSGLGELVGSTSAELEARAVLAALPPAAPTGRVLAYLGMSYHPQMRIREAAEHCLAAAAAMRAGGDLWPACDALWFGAHSLVVAGRYAEAEPVLAELAVLGERLGHPFRSMGPRTAGYRDFFRTGDTAALIASGETDLADSMRMRGGSYSAWTLSAIGEAEYLRGNWDLAEPRFRQGLTGPGSEMRGYRCTVAAWFAFLARTGRTAEALQVFEENRHELPVRGEPATSGAWSLLLVFVEGMYLLGRPEWSAAQYDLVCECIERTGALMAFYAPWYLLERVAGIAALAAGGLARGEEHFRTALDQATELPHVVEGLHVRCWYAHMLLTRRQDGDEARARQLHGQAVEGYRRLRMPRLADLAP